MARRPLWALMLGPIRQAVPLVSRLFTQSGPGAAVEAAECGLAALAMVARHHGHDVDLNGLRRRYPTSIKGATIEQLMAIAADLDLAPRPCGWSWTSCRSCACRRSCTGT
jgi:hypothetical protein